MGSSLAAILNQPVYKTNVKMRQLIYINIISTHMGTITYTSWATTFDCFNSSRNYIYYEV
jgi:hypothetical protein